MHRVPEPPARIIPFCVASAGELAVQDLPVALIAAVLHPFFPLATARILTEPFYAFHFKGRGCSSTALSKNRSCPGQRRLTDHEVRYAVRLFRSQSSAVDGFANRDLTPVYRQPL